ncbi:MAG TPA: helix-turn-helix domain-containing protein [Bryobacteraceae bacterium]|nr:helix-turn-helix domain-containing protein [Bryobacteraceae bacterium]
MRENGTHQRLSGCLNLPAIRQVKGLSLREIADTTKISLRFLQAIEEGEFDLLPGGIYNTSYIRQYARAIDYEETKLLEYYRSMTAVTA